MNLYDRDLHQLQKLESIDARLERHNRMVRLGLIWLSTIGVIVLALLGYAITRL